MFKETIKSHSDDKGFTLVALDAQSAWRMAYAMSQKGYAVKLSRDPGAPWVVQVREVAPCNSTAQAAN